MPCYCPRCGKQSLNFDAEKAFNCTQCEFSYFHNVAAAGAALIEVDSELLLIRRARDPGKGLLGLPGGFVDPFESAEQALQREIHEEIGIDVAPASFEYFGSWANRYLYRNIQYHTQDSYFRVRLAERPILHLQPDEVSEVVWCTKAQLDIEQLAFCSARDALARWLSE
ncbi:NUDIX hydrolase [Neptunicella sp. SCSIO 80796]|uniref:NUDIX hydrolase n=1 Tax=Neptunicella plasticusilytica TaxID=3117012 RepID=UPI003A4D764E